MGPGSAQSSFKSGIPRSRLERHRVTNIRLGRRGLTLIELIVAMSVVAILAAAALPRLDRARTRAMGVALAADLHRLDFLQEQYRSNGHPSYSNDFAELNFVPSTGVDLEITTATDEGWAATATHAKDADVRCSVFHSLANVTNLFPAQQGGRIACARGQERFGVPAPGNNAILN